MKLITVLCVLVWSSMMACGNQQQRHPVVLSDRGRDIHFFSTFGWHGLREGVLVPSGTPLALTCGFRGKVRRATGGDGVVRSEITTKTVSVNLSFPSAAGQQVLHISPHVNKFKDAWDSRHNDATVFFPAVIKHTTVQCTAVYLEGGRKHVSVIQIPVTPSSEVHVWRRSVNIKDVDEVECKAYDLLSSRLERHPRELSALVSLMFADGEVLTTIPRTGILLPFTGAAYFRTAASARTKERLTTVSSEVKNITCVVYHVYQPHLGAYITTYVSRRSVPLWVFAVTVFCISFAFIKLLSVVRALDRRNSTARMYRHL